MANAQGIRAGKAYVSLATDDRKLTAGLKAAEAKLKAFGAGITSVGAKLTGTGAALVTPLVGMAKVFADAGSELADASARTGASVEALSELRHAAGQTGADLAAVETGIRRMQKGLGDAAGGSKEAQAAFAALGLSVADLARRKPDEQFRAVAAAIADIEDPTAKAAAAMEVFGRSGTALVPMIDNLDALTGEARRFGLVWTGEEAEAADKLGDSIDLLGAVVKKAGVSFGAALAPALTEVAQALSATLGTAIKWIGENPTLIGNALKLGTAAAAAGAALVGIGTALGAIASPLGLVTAGLAAGGVALFRYTEFGGQALSWLGTQFGALKTDAEAAFGGIADALKAGDIPLAGQVLWSALNVQWLKGTAALQAIWADWGVAFVEVFRGASFDISRLMVDMFAGIEIGWVKSLETIRGLWQEALSAMSEEMKSTLGVALKTGLAVALPGVKIGGDAAGLDPQAFIERDRSGELARIEADRQAAQAALDDQQAAEVLARRKAAQAGLTDATAALAAAQAEFTALRDQAAGKAAGGPVAARKPGAASEFTPEGLRATLQAAQAKVSAKGTFSASALRSLGAGDSIADRQLETQQHIKIGIDRLNDHARRSGQVFTG